ncbi:uncharacterized protein LOC116417636 [Nasonia vitripennis]|uniref:Uncharacterized protein n=1 Tax=Nasonia vitripennis TaxID=7425 RepID=A0A7M7QJ53_NASVI|nr:uncharacterized protein LOC116417636 [Nasonia vitripennis]
METCCCCCCCAGGTLSSFFTAVCRVVLGCPVFCSRSRKRRPAAAAAAAAPTEGALQSSYSSTDMLCGHEGGIRESYFEVKLSITRSIRVYIYIYIYTHNMLHTGRCELRSEWKRGEEGDWSVSISIPCPCAYPPARAVAAPLLRKLWEDQWRNYFKLEKQMQATYQLLLSNSAWLVISIAIFAASTPPSGRKRITPSFIGMVASTKMFDYKIEMVDLGNQDEQNICELRQVIPIYMAREVNGLHESGIYFASLVSEVEVDAIFGRIKAELNIGPCIPLTSKKDVELYEVSIHQNSQIFKKRTRQDPAA